MAGIADKISGIGNTVAQKGQGMLDSIFPPEKRAELLARLKAFVLKNPKVSAFLLTNVALTAGPMILFAFFSLTVFIFALIVALVLALLSAVAFTLVAVGFALIILFPTVFFTTLTATFLFLWGLGGFYIFKYFNKDSPPGAKGDTIGDKLNGLTGNRLNFVMDNAREGWIERQLGGGQDVMSKGAGGQHAEKPKETASAQTTPKKQVNGHKEDDEGTTSGADHKKRVDSPVNGVKSGANGVRKHVNADGVTNGVDTATKTAGAGDVGEKVKGAPRKLTSAPGTLKGTAVGTVGGATGLT